NPTDQGRLIRLRHYGGNAPYAAADYGFLSSPTLGRDEMSLIDAIAVVRPAACFLQRGVNFRPGLVRSVREGFNVRFDIYEGAMSEKYNDSNYRPAQNVRKGMSSLAAMKIRMLVLPDRVPIGRSEVLQTRLRVSRSIERGPMSAAWAKETGTSLDIGRSITEPMADPRQRSTVDLRAMPICPADTAFTATRSNKARAEICPSGGNRERPPAIVAAICPGRRIAASSMPPSSIVRACSWRAKCSPLSR